MNLLLSRYEKSSNGRATIGKLQDGQNVYYTLEDVVRPENEPKVFGETAIPAGVYNVTVRWSPRFQRDMPHIENVPDFSGVLIHYGNTDADTDGCVLVGTTHEPGQDFIGASRDAFNKLFTVLLQAHGSGDTVTLTIQNNFQEA